MIKEWIIALDPGYIPMSGKQNFGIGRCWSGCAKQAEWVLVSCNFAVVDFVEKTAIGLKHYA